MGKKKDRKTPFPEAGQDENKKAKSNTNQKKRDYGYYSELERGCHISVGSYIKKVLFKIHSDPYFSGS
jgi:hypothetical protein